MKRFLVWVCVGFTVFWLAVFLVVGLTAAVHDPVKKGSILRVSLDGPVVERDTPHLASLLGAESPPSLRALTESIRAAASDGRIKGLVLEVVDPQLSVAALGELEEAMAVFRTSGKWNVAFLETAGELGPGDGALAAASCASEVVLAPSGEVTLGGLRVTVPFVKGTLDKLEIQPFVTKRQDYKTAPNTFTESGFTPAHRESLQALVDDLSTVVAEHVARRRQVDLATVRAWQRQGLMLAPEAVTKHVVDRTGYWEEIRSAARSAAGRDDPFVPLSVYSHARRIHESGPRVALIVGEGAIHRGRSSSPLQGEPDMGAQTIARAFREAREDGVAGVLFRVDSPGGSYLASDIIRHEVELTRARKIPVVVSMGAYAASGGYFVTLGADKVVADAGSITGSIGVFAVTLATRRFWHDRLGITFGEVHSPADTVGLSMLDLPGPRERALLDAEMDRIYQDFLAKVAASRGKKAADIQAVAQGRVWSGREALARGLVDELGSLETALDRLKELAGVAKGADVTLLELPEPEGPLAVLQQVLSTRAHVADALPPGLRRLLAQVSLLARAPADGALALPPGLEVRF
jgi:protease-4